MLSIEYKELTLASFGNGENENITLARHSHTCFTVFNHAPMYKGSVQRLQAPTKDWAADSNY